MPNEKKVLIINCFETYEKRVELLVNYFSKNGYKTNVLTSDWLHMNKAVRESCPDGFEMLHVKPYYKNLSAGRLISHYGFAKSAYEKINEYAPDILWVLIPPNSLAKTASEYKKAHPETKLIMDFIDMWPETMPISSFKNLPPFSFWRNLRDNYVKHADLLVTECELYHSILKNKTDKPIQTLYLARKVHPIMLKSDFPNDRLSFCYIGSINNIIDINAIGRIITSLNCPVDMHIIGDGEKKQELLDTISEAGGTIYYYGKIYDIDQKKQIFDKCHLGLNIMKNSVFVGLTMKSMDYFEYGLPIINNIKGDTWSLVENYKVGINYDSTIKREDVVSIANNRSIVRTLFEKNFSDSAFTSTMNEIIHILNP